MSDLWISHSSIGDYLKCPRLYYLKSIYKDPKTGRKINIINPYMTLGIVVHDVLENLAKLPSEERFNTDLLEIFEKQWQEKSGKRGGFTSETVEEEFKQRGKKMIQMVIDNPEIIKNKAIRLKDDGFLPNFYISPEEKIKLCGKVDWIEYIPDDDSIHIIDFKTGKNEEDGSSLQLPIYCLLAQNLQKRKISKVSYWYLDKDTKPVEIPLPDFEQSKKELLEIARQMREARENNLFNCLRGGCYACNPLQSVLDGEAEFVGTSGYQDIYIIP